MCVCFSLLPSYLFQRPHTKLRRGSCLWPENWLPYSGTSAFGSAILRFPNPGMKVCTPCWTLNMGFLAGRLVNSPPVMEGREINSVFLTCRSFLKIPAPGCYLWGSSTRDLKWQPGFRSLHCINSSVGSLPILVVFRGPYLRKMFSGHRECIC